MERHLVMLLCVLYTDICGTHFTIFGGKRGGRGNGSIYVVNFMYEHKSKHLAVLFLVCMESVCVRACVHCVAEWLSSYALGQTTTGLRVQTQH